MNGPYDGHIDINVEWQKTSGYLLSVLDRDGEIVRIWMKVERFELGAILLMVLQKESVHQRCKWEIW